MPRATRWFGLAIAVALVDQAVKWLVLARLAGGGRPEIPRFFTLVLVFYKGAAFSFLADAQGWQTPLLVAFAVAAAVVVGVLIVRNPAKSLLCSGLGLILGGAIGNVVDRLRFGSVVDFLDFHAL